MKKIAFIVLLLFLAGCQLIIKPDTKIPEFDIYKGKDGISIKLVSGAPPEKIVATSQESYSYDIKVIVENKGAVDAEGVVALILEKNFMEAEKKYQALGEIIEGREKFISGGVKEMDFRVNTKKLSKKDYGENPKASIQAATCYKYKTRLTALTCIDTSTYRGAIEKGACKETDLILTEGQGAPVAVTRIEPTLIVKGDEAILYLKVFVENVGSGEIVKEEEITAACREEPAEHNIVYLESATVGGKRLSCEPEKEGKPVLKIIEGSNDNYFTCTLADNTQGFDAKSPSFVTDLSLTLSYGYETTISKKVEIVVV